MRLIDTVCDQCGAKLTVDMDKKQAFCEHCGAQVLIDDEVIHMQYDNAEEAGYNFEKGRQRAQAEARRAQQTGSYNTKQYTQPPKKSSNTWLWVLGWIIIFPLPLTILLARKKDMNTALKVVIIGAAWLVYLIIAIAGNAGDKKKDDKTAEKSATTVEQSAENPQKADTEDAYEENITKLDIGAVADYKMTVGDEPEETWVQARVRDKDAFSPEDVDFISENPEIATVEYSKSVMDTYLYFRITAVSAGETNVYAQTKDGKVQSDKLKVLIEGPEEPVDAIKGDLDMADIEHMDPSNYSPVLEYFTLITADTTADDIAAYASENGLFYGDKEYTGGDLEVRIASEKGVAVIGRYMDPGENIFFSFSRGGGLKYAEYCPPGSEKADENSIGETIVYTASGGAPMGYVKGTEAEHYYLYTEDGVRGSSDVSDVIDYAYHLKRGKE